MPSKAVVVAVALVVSALTGPVASRSAIAQPTTAPAATAASSVVNVDAALAKADRQIAAALAFLQAHQNADGSWGGETDPPAITALCLRAFAMNGQAHDRFVTRGYERLLSYQLPDGGIYRDLLANYNTSIAISALTAARDPGYQPAIDRAVAYLRNLQWTPETRPEYPGREGDRGPEQNQGQQVVTDDRDPFYGGWGYGGRSRGPGRPDLSNAQVALDALHDAGVPTSDPAYQRAVDFLSRCQNLQATNDQAWAGNDGGFVYGPAGDRSGESMAGEYVDADGKRLLRSYGSMTYAGLKSMIYAGLTPDDPRVQAATAWIAANWTLDENSGMRLANPDNAKAGLFYYYHTLGRAMSARGEPTLTLADGRVVDWRVELVDKLGTLQQADGSWVGERRWMENNPILVTCYSVLALQEARDELKRHAR